MLRALTSLVVPPRCAICEAPAGCDAPICERCRRELSDPGPLRYRVGGIDVISAASYERAARRLVARLKFSSRIGLAKVAADAMVAGLAGERVGALVPVPASPARARSRGFDTAWLLARLVSQRTGCRLVSCLERDDGPRQVGRPRARRVCDPPRVRRMRLAPRAEPEPVWLVDDVVTTGATLLACAGALREAGVAELAAITFARA